MLRDGTLRTLESELCPYSKHHTLPKCRGPQTGRHATQKRGMPGAINWPAFRTSGPSLKERPAPQSSHPASHTGKRETEMSSVHTATQCRNEMRRWREHSSHIRVGFDQGDKFLFGKPGPQSWQTGEVRRLPRPEVMGEFKVPLGFLTRPA